MGSIPGAPENSAHGDPNNFAPPWQKLPDDQLQAMFAVSERGFGSAWDLKTLSEKVPEDLACQESAPCTDLLADPAGVIEDPKRLPDHLCDIFMTASTAVWGQASIRPTGSLKWLDWQYMWPLPIGREAVATQLLAGEPLHSMEGLLGQAPFTGFEEALWALRLADRGASIDVFGLGIRSARSDLELPYDRGQLKYVLRGSGTHMFPMIERITQWWDLLRGEITGGRPIGVGINLRWESRIEFLLYLRKAVHALRANNDPITQERIANLIGCEARQLRRWLKRFGIDWKDVPKIS